MSLEKTARSLSPDVSQSFAQKKARVENEVYNPPPIQPLVSPSSQLGNRSPITTALDIKNALSNINRLQSIGNCPTIMQDYKDNYGYPDDKRGKSKDEKINDVRIFRGQKQY